MPRPAEDETAAPSVYRPEGGPAPVYEEYRDPASAHGWLNAYDETRELPRVAPAVPVPGPGRADRRRAARDAGGLRAKRVAVVVGAVGAASVAALVAGFTFSSSSGGGQVEQDRAKHTVGESSAPASGERSGSASAAPSVKSAASVAESPSARSTSTAGTPVSASEGHPATATPTHGASATPSPTATATSPTASPTYGGHGWGHGRGGGRGR
ncbi:hypothetical protein [Streptomyces sp. NPDC086777]|uniref:hypothetical protein n=1 Tax=Streptomyces sp. NPDC086777 TaxID=3154866 RepID=UPI00344C6D1A